jgi:protein-S-isoprenylcysteine O-methyltransferase Ste14
MRHPGYFAMLISIPASALAIGSWFALVPAIVFALVLLSSNVIRKTPAAISAAVFVRYVSCEPITRFRITRCPSGHRYAPLNTQTL